MLLFPEQLPEGNMVMVVATLIQFVSDSAPLNAIISVYTGDAERVEDILRNDVGELIRLDTFNSPTHLHKVSVEVFLLEPTPENKTHLIGLFQVKSLKNGKEPALMTELRKQARADPRKLHFTDEDLVTTMEMGVYTLLRKDHKPVYAFDALDGRPPTPDEFVNDTLWGAGKSNPAPDDDDWFDNYIDTLNLGTTP
ncbi:hypothetical protein N9917_00455 [Deltaproteobacteria bacterium]|nr:hypothetical protein [Deltaproteobacteria bacterium]